MQFPGNVITENDREKVAQNLCTICQMRQILHVCHSVFCHPWWKVKRGYGVMQLLLIRVFALLSVTSSNTDELLHCSQIHLRRKLVLVWRDTLQNLSTQCLKNIHSQWRRNHNLWCDGNWRLSCIMQQAAYYKLFFYTALKYANALGENHSMWYVSKSNGALTVSPNDIGTRKHCIFPNEIFYSAQCRPIPCAIFPYSKQESYLSQIGCASASYNNTFKLQHSSLSSGSLCIFMVLYMY